MTRQEVYREIEDMFGLVPSFFKEVPDSSLELEWKPFKTGEKERGILLFCLGSWAPAGS
jgi:hypothetical protein